MNDILAAHFDFTASDMAEVSERAIRRSNYLRAQQFKSAGVVLVVLGLATYAVTDFTSWGVHDRVVFAATFSGITGLAMLVPRTSAARMRLTKYYRNEFHGDGPFRCEVEIQPEALVVRQLGTETRRAWQQVRAVNDIADGIEFEVSMGAILVRNRAFATAESRQAFLALAKRYSAQRA